MPLTRRDVLDTARTLVAEYGLADLTMRRLAQELGVQAGAIYWHVPNKQTLLAELAEDLLAQVPIPSARKRWDRQLTQLATDLRSMLLSHQDAAELVAAGRASSLGESHLGKRIVEIAESAGHTHRSATAARDALLHFVMGFTIEEQTHATMARHGAAAARLDDPDATFGAALAVVIRGVDRSRPAARAD